MSGSNRRKQRKATRQQSQSLQRQIKRIASPSKGLPPAERYAQKAAAHWDQLEFDEAMRLFEKAHRTSPGNLSILIDLGRAHLLRYNPTKAAELFDKALKRSKRSLPVLLRVAESYQKIPRHDLAEPFYREAASYDDIPLAGLHSYAEVLERLHRIDEAQAVLERAAELKPDGPQTNLQQAKLLRRTNDPSGSAKALRNLLQRPKLPYDVKWMAEYELAGLSDKAGQPKEAMEAWIRAKEVLRTEGELFRNQLDKINAENDRMLETLKPDQVQRWSDRGASFHPARKLCVLTGHPRSGTTLLEQILDSHPGAVSADESTIFGNDVATPIRRNADEALPIPEVLDALTTEELLAYRERYWNYTEAFIGEATGDRVLIDKNPALTLQLPTMAAVFPEVKVLFAIRDPRDVVLSCFMQKFMMNSVSLSYLDLESACRQYARIMESWLQIRDLLPNPWMQLRYEDLVEDAEREARRVLSFLDLPWDAEVLGFHQHAKAKFVSSPTYEDVTKKIYRGAMQRWRKYESFFEPHLHHLEPFIKEFGYE